MSLLLSIEHRIGLDRPAVRRVSLGMLSIIVIGLFARAVPIMYDQLTTPCRGAGCNEWQRSTLSTTLSPHVTASLYIGREGVHLAVAIVVATLIAWRAAHDRTAWLGAFSFICFASVITSDTIAALGRSGLGWRLLVESLGLLGTIGFFTFFLVFPNGVFSPRWMRWVLAGWIALIVASYLVPRGTPLHYYGKGWLLLVVVYAATTVASQISRYRRASTPVQRQQMKWVMAGFGSGFLGFAITVLVFPLIGPNIIPNRAMFAAIGGLLAYLSFMLVPISIGLAMIRYRLWDVDILINRALVYGLLTACVVALYVGVVIGVGEILPARGSQVGTVIATATTALALSPLRNHLQHLVNRLLYGERDTPYDVLTRLGQRLSATVSQEEVLPTVVASLAEALHLPYVAIVTQIHGAPVTMASLGIPSPDTISWPLTYQQEHVGELRLAPRARGESFGRSDRRLIGDLALQAGAAVHAVRLAIDLRQSHERLLATREDERRLLRRELHDGLGPQLASQTLTLDAARRLRATDPAAANALLDELSKHVESAVADVRNLIQDLRPTALDERGLLAAITERIERFASSGIAFDLETVDDLPLMPAQVEVAAYRICAEAMTNVVRHANAHACTIRIQHDRLEHSIRIEVDDDGTGRPAGTREGVGLRSMRERARELGGSFSIDHLAPNGTRVSSILPLAEGESSHVRTNHHPHR